MDYKIEWLGGLCPVQAEGIVSGKPFYFRSRGTNWSFIVGSDIINPEWSYEEHYGEWPSAGWISEEEALFFIEKSVKKYLESLK